MAAISRRTPSPWQTKRGATSWSGESLVSRTSRRIASVRRRRRGRWLGKLMPSSLPGAAARPADRRTGRRPRLRDERRAERDRAGLVWHAVGYVAELGEARRRRVAYRGEPRDGAHLRGMLPGRVTAARLHGVCAGENDPIH